MKVSSMFPSKYLKAADIGSGKVLTIRDVLMEEVGDAQKVVVRFKETTKGCVLNRTNSDALATLYGDDSDGWLNQRVALRVASVQFQGRMVDGIRLGAPPVAVAKPATVEFPQDTEDDVNF